MQYMLLIYTPEEAPAEPGEGAMPDMGALERLHGLAPGRRGSTVPATRSPPPARRRRSVSGTARR